MAKKPTKKPKGRKGSKDNPTSLPMPVNKGKREGGKKKPTFNKDRDVR